MTDDLTARIRKILRELRSDEDRRKSNDPNYSGPERRSGKTEDVETKQSLPDV